MKEFTVVLHSIAEDGLPADVPPNRLAFIFDGCIVSGWPIGRSDSDGPLWEANRDVGHNRPFSGVTHWVELPDEMYAL